MRGDTRFVVTFANFGYRYVRDAEDLYLYARPGPQPQGRATLLKWDVAAYECSRRKVENRHGPLHKLFA